MFDLVPWRKRMGKDLMGFKSEMDNLFNRFFDFDFPPSQEFFKEGQWAPRVDISEGEKDITIQAEIPGCEAKDIEVSLEGRFLTIKGEKSRRKEIRSVHRTANANTTAGVLGRVKADLLFLV